MSKYVERIYAHIHPEPNTGCWLWAGAHDPRTGYGTHRFPVGGVNKVQNVHRVVYLIERGSLPLQSDGLCLDHICRNTACVNPDHLEVVTYSENVNRGVSPAQSSRRMAGNKLRKKR